MKMFDFFKIFKIWKITTILNVNDFDFLQNFGLLLELTLC
jgi:hypothetical protein